MAADSSSSSSSSSSDTEAPPKPRQAYQPFQVSQLRALASARPSASSTSKHVASTVHQLSNVKAKSDTSLASHSIPSLELASGNANDVTVIDSSSDSSSSVPVSPISLTGQKPPNHPIELSEYESMPPNTVASRAKVQLERDVNTVRSNFEGYQVQTNKRLDRMEDRQTRFEKQQEQVLGKLDILINRTEELPALNTPTIKNEKSVTDSYFTMANQIQGRRYRDKAVEGIPIKHKSQAIAFTQEVAKASLGGVRHLTSQVPKFYFKDGQPDFFPAQFTGKDGYCKPRPHWNIPFADNHHWFSVFIKVFRSMIPADESEFAAVCNQFTDRQILVLLHDGPFKSLSGGWKRENKPKQTKGSEAENEATESRKVDKKAKKRVAGRLEHKTLTRQTYRPLVIQVAGPEWNALWAKSVMSPDLTDSEGGKLVKRPGWRAEWSTEMYEGIDDTEWGKELAKPGVHRPLARRTVELVDDVPPVIYSGTGEDKTLVKIPRAMLSKDWRKTPKGAAWMKASAHLIDNNLRHKPDISAFLKSHRSRKLCIMEREEEPEREEVVAYDGEDEDEDFSIGDGGGEGEGKDNGEPVVTNVSTSGKIEIDPQLLGPSQAKPQARRPRLHGAKVIGLSADVPAIQTNLIAPTSHPMGNAPLLPPYLPLQPQHPIPVSLWDVPAQVVHQHPPSAPASPSHADHVPAAESQVPTTYYNSNSYSPHLESSTQPPQSFWQMPPPPTLSQQNATIHALEPTEKKKKKKRSKAKAVEQDDSGSLSAPEATNQLEEPPKKRSRGRPPGSKNKKTIEKERLAANSR
ncbi:hypothetical protein RSOL_390340, partial [Rhizoctonia solani AG-3 Rhs1AP]